MRSSSGPQQYIERIDGMGGARQAIENGYVQKEIQDAAYATQRAIEAGEQVVVGVNQFQSRRTETPTDLLRVDETVQAEQIGRLQTAPRRTATRRRWLPSWADSARPRRIHRRH